MQAVSIKPESSDAQEVLAPQQAAVTLTEPTATTENTKKRRNQCPVRHWYREGLQLRRGIIVLPIDINETIYKPIDAAQPSEASSNALIKDIELETAAAEGEEEREGEDESLPLLTKTCPPRKITAEKFENSQMSIVREFCVENRASTFKPQQIGYIYAERSASGQLAAAPPPSDFDKYGLPTDHLKYPVVVSYENHWYLPCSLKDRCRIHHDLFFKRDPSEAIKRFAPYQIPKKSYPWDDIARGEAARRFGGEVIPTLGNVVGLHTICVPPNVPGSRAIRDLFPDYTEDRTIWHLSDTPTPTPATEGICSLIPISRLRKEDIRMFLAIVVYQGGNVWIPTMEFVEVPLHVANPCQQCAPRQQNQHNTGDVVGNVAAVQQIEMDYANGQLLRQRPEFMSPPGCMKKIDQLLLPPQSAAISLVQTWPPVKTLMDVCADEKGLMREFVMLKTSPTKVVRVVFGGEFRLSLQTIRSLEEIVAIDLPRANVKINCPDLLNTHVCIECYTQLETASLLDLPNKESIGIISYDGSENVIKADPLVVTLKYCRCEFTYSSDKVGACRVICGPDDLQLGATLALTPLQRPLVQNRPEVTAVVTASAINSYSAMDPSAKKYINNETITTTPTITTITSLPTNNIN